MLRVGTARLMLAVFFLLGLMFGTSLKDLASAALRAAKSTTKDDTVPIVATNAPNPSLGDGWEYAFRATREYSSKEPPDQSEPATKWLRIVRVRLTNY